MVKVENMWACKSHIRILNAYIRIAQRVAAFMRGQTVTKCVWVAVDTVFASAMWSINLFESIDLKTVDILIINTNFLNRQSCNNFTVNKYCKIEFISWKYRYCH